MYLRHAQRASEESDGGNIAVGLLYDCFEHLILAAVAHSGEKILDPNPEKTPHVHKRRREQYEAIYGSDLPPDHFTIRKLLDRRNAARYVNPKAKLPPSRIPEFERGKVAGYIKMMEDYFSAVVTLLETPYKRPRP